MRKKSNLKKQDSERGMVEARPGNFGEWTCKMTDESIIGPVPAVNGISGMHAHPIKVAPRRDSSLNPIGFKGFFSSERRKQNGREKDYF